METIFGRKLKKLREEKGLTQEELANMLNVSRQAVYKWEADKGYPDIENLIRISDIFEVTIDELIRTDKKLQKKITIDDEKYFEQFYNPGFYIGMILIFVSVFNDGNYSETLMILGLLSIIFFDDLVRSIKNMFSKRNN